MAKKNRVAKDEDQRERESQARGLHFSQPVFRYPPPSPEEAIDCDDIEETLP